MKSFKNVQVICIYIQYNSMQNSPVKNALSMLSRSYKKP